jgi:CubicO group peptidase (beta-lactamase class C family)
MAPDFNSLGAGVLAAINNSVVPGAVIAVGHEGRVGFMQAFGNRQIEPEQEPATVDTVYDLASLTKALVTSLLAMKAVQQGVLDLNTSLGQRLPALADRPEVTLGLVLAHAAGFAAHRRFYEAVLGQGGRTGEAAAGREAIVQMAAREPLAYPPGSRSVYSDLGFILLGDLLERALGARLDELAQRLIFQPLQLGTLGFVDLAAGPPPATFRGHAVAATERCPVRGRLLVGEVHDLNAYAMGGIAGHAGLFGSVGEVLKLALALCDAYRGGSSPLVDPEVLRLFWRPGGVPGSTWRLGWDGPAERGSLAGSLISRRSVGHLSFTGCSLWIDPEQATSVIVLTNRIHPEVRDDARFRTLRPALCDAALQAIGYQAR